MTTRHLRIFCTVYLSGSMTEAAKQLYMTQPSVSQAIRELEEHYQVRLFERLYHRLYPTKSGDQLYQSAAKILGMLDELDTTLLADTQTQTLEVGLFLTAGMLVFPWMQAFHELHPSVKVNISCFNGKELKERLRNAKLDLAVMEETKDPDFVQEVFASDRLVAIADPEFAVPSQRTISVEALSRMPLLLRETGAGVRDQFDEALNSLGLSFDVKWESSSSLVLLEAAVHKEGIAILPYMLAKEAIDRGDVVELNVTGIDFNRRMALTWHKDKYISNIMQDFINTVKKVGVAAQTKGV